MLDSRQGNELCGLMFLYDFMDALKSQKTERSKTNIYL